MMWPSLIGALSGAHGTNLCMPPPVPVCALLQLRRIVIPAVHHAACLALPGVHCCRPAATGQLGGPSQQVGIPANVASTAEGPDAQRPTVQAGAAALGPR